MADWRSIAAELARRLHYQALECEHDGKAGEACCLDLHAVRRFEAAVGESAAWVVPDGRLISLTELAGQGDS